MAKDEIYSELWYRALKAEIGIAVPTENIKLLRADLFKARELLGDPELEEIIMVTPPGGKEVWLCKKQMNLSEK